MEKAKFVKYIGNSLNGFNFIVMLKDENASTRKKHFHTIKKRSQV